MPSEPQDVSFKNRGITLAGHLWVPQGEYGDQSLAAVVVATPGSSVKEQIGANYAHRLTERGFVTLTFDPAYQGQSSGEPRDLEDPAARVEDIRCAVDFLTTLPFVAEDRLGLLGVCAGGGYAANAAMTEHRIKALTTVVPVNIGRARRQAGSEVIMRVLGEVGRQRTLEARGGPQKRELWIPDSIQDARAAGITDRDVLDAVEFYRTPRGFSENSTNRRYFASLGPMLGFDAFHLVDELLTQPLQVIVAGRRGATNSFEDGECLFQKAIFPDEFYVVEGAGHYDLYDKSPYIDEAVDKIADFFHRQLR